MLHLCNIGLLSVQYVKLGQCNMLNWDSAICCICVILGYCLCNMLNWDSAIC